MITIPAIEIRNGACLALNRTITGSSEALTCSPVGLARSWARLGFVKVQVAEPTSTHDHGLASTVEQIVRDGSVGVQVAINHQSIDMVDRLMDLGADQVVLPATAIEDPAWIDSIAPVYHSAVVVSAVVLDQRAVFRGWNRRRPVDVFELIQELDGLPLGGVLVSASTGGGSATSGELMLLEDIAQACDFPLYTLGGVCTMDDLRALEHRGVSGVVLGTALYSGHLDARAVAQEFMD